MLMGGRSNSRVENLVSAGGVVYRQREGRIETVLCGRCLPSGAKAAMPNDDGPSDSADPQGEEIRWSLAKGTPDQGETIEETAIREVQEETGLDVEVQSPIGSINYWFTDRGGSIRYHKTVHFYLMAPVGGNTEDHDPEFDVVKWFPLDEAMETVAYPNEAGVLRQARELISERGASA